MKRTFLAALLLMTSLSYAQLGTTTQIRRGSTLPTTCVGGDIFMKSGSSAGFYFNVAAGSCSWVGPAAVAGLGDPGSNGIVKRTATNTTSVAAAADVVALFSTCSGTQYLGADGSCHNASSGGLGDPGSNGIIKRTALNTTAAATSTDVLGLWTGTCSSATFLRGDGSCASASGAGGTVPDTGTTANIAIVSDGSHGITLGSGSISTGGTGTSALNLTSTTISGLAGLSPTSGDVVLVSDASTCGDVSTGGGSVWEQVRYNGSSWAAINCSAGYIYRTTQTLGAAATNITFSSIPSGYTILVVTCRARSDAATGAANGQIRFNGDTGSNYTTQAMYRNGSTTGFTSVSATTSGMSGSGTFPGTSSTSTYPSVLEITIPNYADTSGVFIKQALWRNGFIAGSVGTSNVYLADGTIDWSGSASTAITSISIATASGNLITGSTCTLELR